MYGKPGLLFFINILQPDLILANSIILQSDCRLNPSTNLNLYGLINLVQACITLLSPYKVRQAKLDRLGLGLESLDVANVIWP